MGSMSLEHLGRAFRLTRVFFLVDPPEHNLYDFVFHYLYRPLSVPEPTIKALQFNHTIRHHTNSKLYPDEQLSEFDLVQHVRDEINIDFLPIMLKCKSQGKKSEQLIAMESSLISVVQPYIEAHFTPSGPQVVLTSYAVDTLIYTALLAFLSSEAWTEYIARCPECERIFLRERKDKTFCRKTCRDTWNTRLWRYRRRQRSRQPEDQVSIASSLATQLPVETVEV